MSLDQVDIQGGMDEAPAIVAERIDTARHRGMKNALQALRPGLLICDPDTFEIRYANESACDLLGIEDRRFPTRVPKRFTLSRQEENHGDRRSKFSFFRAEIDGDDSDVRAVPVFSATGKTQAVIVTIRDYQGISWSMFEMLDRMPIAVVAVSADGRDVRYINRTAVREIYAGRAGGRPRRTGRGLIGDTVHGWWRSAPDTGEGRAEINAGRLKLDMHFANLDGEEGLDGEKARLVYWDARTIHLPQN